jgi:DNA repair photolyase
MARQAVLPLSAVPTLVPTLVPELPVLSPVGSRIPRLKPTDPRRDATSGVAGALEVWLRRAARRGDPLVLGTAEDPYEPSAEGRSPLAALRHHEGLEVSVTTRSPEILRDLDLLVDLDRRCSVTVSMVLAALDPFLVRRLEPQAAEPKARLRAVARLAAEGIAVRIVCAPLRFGLNDSERALRPLFAAAREAGAQDVVPALDRPTRFARLRGVFALRPQQRPHRADFDTHLAVFRRLRLEHGFPRPMAGRG